MQATCGATGFPLYSSRIQHIVIRAGRGCLRWKDDAKSSIRDPVSIGGWRRRAWTIFVHALALAATINLFRYERKLGRAGAGALIDLAIVALAIAFAFVAHLIEIALWAVLLVICGEFPEFENAFYHSAVNYTILGYGDLLLTSAHVRCFDRDGLCCYTTISSG
jgi:hypothetical protein